MQPRPSPARLTGAHVKDGSLTKRDFRVGELPAGSPRCGGTRRAPGCRRPGRSGRPGRSRGTAGRQGRARPERGSRQLPGPVGRPQCRVARGTRDPAGSGRLGHRRDCLFDNITASERNTECRLLGKPDLDIIGFANSITLDTISNPGAEIPLVITTGHRFTSPGELQLECSGLGVRLRGVVIRAVRSGELTVKTPSG